MVEIIKGFIVDATAPKFFVKKDGTTAQRVTLHIKAVTNDPYPKEIAVNCAGDLCNWAPFAGSFTVVECEYVNRVFPFEKNGEKMLGNDVYARSIKIAPTQPAAPPAPPTQPELPAAPQPLALPAPAQPAGLLPAPSGEAQAKGSDDLPF